MTRFARAKGSKASNERIPEEASTWQEMKQQLEARKKESEDAKKRRESEKERQSNYNKFLKEVEEEKISKSVWSDFPESVSLHNFFNKSKSKDKAKSACKANKSANDDDDGPPEEASSKAAVEKPIVKKNKIKKRKLEIDSNGLTNTEVKPKKVKKKDKSVNNVEKTVTAAPEVNPTTACDESSAKSAKKSKKLKTKSNDDASSKEAISTEKTKAQKKKDWSHMSEEQIKNRMDKLREKRKKRTMKMKESKQSVKEKDDVNNTSKVAEKQNDATQSNNTNSTNMNTKSKPTRAEKSMKRMEYKRKKPEKPNEENIIMINGEKVIVVNFNGFPVRKEDFDRLTGLRKQMISKGIPRSQVERTLQLERRRCEKALTRLKKNLCFNCRKSGHNLSDCPELQGSADASGICFKCGSTEHTHFQCKVAKGGAGASAADSSFKFASCFICREQGHIARQCPDNPRGLYPKGGACKLCGDVTHFKKDCPTLQNNNEEDKGVKADLLDVAQSVDDLGQTGADRNKNSQTKTKKIKKVVF